MRGIFRKLMASRLGRSSFVSRYLVPRLLGERDPRDPRDVVLVLLHEASRTGAPILGWNIIRDLVGRYQVICVPFGGGEIEADLRSAATFTTAALLWLRRKPRSADAIAHALVANYRPLYVIANSVETHSLVPHFARAGVPVVALFHEFAAYTRPLSKLEDVFGWADEVVFSSQMTIESAATYYQGLERRAGVHLIPQGRSEIPVPKGSAAAERRPPAPLRPKGREEAFVVLGAGSVHLRKGVELFVATAAAARRLRPDLPLLFVWIGDGFDPQRELGYSIYLDEQIKRSDLGDSLIMRPPVDDLDALYPQADLFLLSSRLDPQPNVAIDAMTFGVPVLCFEGAAGTAEILASDPATSQLVIPHLDAHAAAVAICRLASEGSELVELKTSVQRLAQATFDMPTYIERLDALGRAAAARRNTRDAELIAAADALDPSFVLAPGEETASRAELAQTALIRWRLWGGSTVELAHANRPRPYRRACAGFHPGIYALAHEDACLANGRDPLAHWIENGRPAGAWSRRVYSPLPAARGDAGRAAGLRTALHGHFHYPELVDDLLARLAANQSRPHLILTCDTEAKADQLRSALAAYQGPSQVRLMPNRGRDIGPLLTGLADVISSGDYDVIGHVHGKRSHSTDAQMGERWRDFLFENLVGGRFAMVDTAIAAFAEDASLGLLMAEDPHVVGWNANLELAQTLARRMGIDQPLPMQFDFPLGTMFWARPAALKPLLDLHLTVEDYPEEPAPDDGTLLHALERLIPFAARQTGLSVAGLRVANTTW
ncbi:rhamnan synthesis F family protein [Ancylobacter sp. WKF20]|uniref:rhamnan synthesis F family protein n=1 Tax=Ancylobacter sp. WKF20 TaxID=3039801 RepID=UPI00243423B1|nr:rhamnan synthesis F family protein [Ancylobacter sp. WKF20]WGD28379.1 rhamnan synthesis F family protein [Ancylobacter sp. WKF20]